MKSKITSPKKVVEIKSFIDVVDGTLYNYVDIRDPHNKGVVLFCEDSRDPRRFVLIEVAGNAAGHQWGINDEREFTSILDVFTFTKFDGTITISN
jgi:hypothetical protein